MNENNHKKLWDVEHLSQSSSSQVGKVFWIASQWYYQNNTQNLILKTK